MRIISIDAPLTTLAKPVDKNPAGCIAGETTSWQQRRPRGLSVTCRARKTKSPVSRGEKDGRGSLRGEPSKASEKRFSRCERRCVARQRRQTRKGRTELMDGLTNERTDRQTDRQTDRHARRNENNNTRYGPGP